MDGGDVHMSEGLGHRPLDCNLIWANLANRTSLGKDSSFLLILLFQRFRWLRPARFDHFLLQHTTSGPW